MMKFKFLTFFLALLCVSSVAIAQWEPNSHISTPQPGMSKMVWDEDNGKVLYGYCSPETVIGRIDGVGFRVMKDIKVTVAIRLSEGMAGILKGRKIHSLKVGVTQDVKDVYVFIRKADNTILWDKTTELKWGWNDVSLETPLEIPAVDELYLGYSYIQTYDEFSALPPYIAGASINSVYNGLFMAKDDEPLVEYHDQGALCLLAEVDGSESDFDYVGSLKDAYSSYPYSFKGLNKPASLSLSFYNEGEGYVSRITLGRTFNGVELSDTVCIFNKIIQPNKIGRLDLKVNPAENGEYCFYLKKVESTPVPVATSKAVKISVCENKDVIRRMALVEEFTSQNCGNCPAGQAKIHEVIKNKEDRVAMVLHHSGYDSDAFTTSESNEYCYFFNTQPTFAPAVMMNRTYIPDFDAKMYRSPVLEPNNMDGDRLSQEIEMPALVSVGIKSSYNDVTRELTVTVSGYKAADLLGEHIGLNVYVLESKYIARQRDLSVDNEAFEHNNFLRNVLSDVKGDVITFNPDGTYSMNYTCILPQEYVTPKGAKTTAHPKNMHIVAFIANYDSVNPDNCTVLNVNKTKSLTDQTIGLKLESIVDKPFSVYSKDGVVSIAGEYKSFKLYNLQGRAVRNERLVAGIYIIKIVDANHVEHVQKVLVH